MAKITHYIPMACYNNIYDVDYNKLYSQGKRIILFDLDNTLIPYTQHLITEKILHLFSDLTSMGFKIGIISNNNKKRLETFLDGNNYPYVHYALKPRLHGYRKIYKILNNPPKEEVVSIGDQLLTDVVGSNRFGFDVILVKSIERKSEHWYTRINRLRSKRILKKIKKIDANIYQQIKKVDEKNE